MSLKATNRNDIRQTETGRTGDRLVLITDREAGQLSVVISSADESGDGRSTLKWLPTKDQAKCLGLWYELQKLSELRRNPSSPVCRSVASIILDQGERGKDGVVRFCMSCWGEPFQNFVQMIVSTGHNESEWYSDRCQTVVAEITLDAFRELLEAMEVLKNDPDPSTNTYKAAVGSASQGCLQRKGGDR